MRIGTRFIEDIEGTFDGMLAISSFRAVATEGPSGTRPFGASDLSHRGTGGTDSKARR
jgi:hypothetical protein